MSLGIVADRVSSGSGPDCASTCTCSLTYLPVHRAHLPGKAAVHRAARQPQPDAEDVTHSDHARPVRCAAAICQHEHSRARASFCSVWSSAPIAGRAVPYCEFLLEAGYDVFAFESRGQGQSPSQPGYEPMQWVTEFEVDDFRAALAYLKERPDADPRGVGFFGISKGGGAGLYCRLPTIPTSAAASPTASSPRTPRWCRTCASGSSSTRSGPGCRRTPAAAGITATCASIGLRHRSSRERHCTLSAPGNGASPSWRARPLLMIHGGADTYIKPDMAQILFDAGRVKPRKSGSWTEPSTTRRSTSPAQATRNACSPFSTSTWPAGRVPAASEVGYPSVRSRPQEAVDHGKMINSAAMK